MTDTDLDRLDALAAAATPGPWHPTWLALGIRHLDRNWEPYHENLPDEFELPCRHHDDSGMTDAAFICEARTALPALIAEVRRLRAEKRVAEEFIRDVAWHFWGGVSWSPQDVLAHCADYFGCTVAELERRMEDAGS